MRARLAHGHAVAHGNGESADTGFIFHVEDRTVDGHAVGVGAVEHKHAAACAGGLVHQFEHRAVICVIAEAYVLYVDHHHVDILHGLGHSLGTSGAVERDDAHAGFGINAAGHVLAGIGRAAESMLGREDTSHVDAAFAELTSSVWRSPTTPV